MEAKTKSKKGFKAGSLHKMYKHGHSGDNRSLTYVSWAKMKERCNYKGDKRYKHYKDVSYDDKWEYFEGFLEDMGERQVGTSLDRIDCNKGYSKDNCRWATPEQQSANTTRNFYYNVFGEVLCQEQAARKMGITTKSIRGMRRRNKFPENVSALGYLNKPQNLNPL